MRGIAGGYVVGLALALVPGPAAALDPVAMPGIVDATLPAGDDPAAGESRALARAARHCLAEQGRMLGRASRQGFVLDDGARALMPMARWNRSYVLQGIDERAGSLAGERASLPAATDAAPDRAALLRSCLRWSERSVNLLRRMVGGWRDPGLPGRLRRVGEAAAADYAALKALSEGKAALLPGAIESMGSNRLPE